MSDNKYGPFFDILSFFIVNGESIKYQWGPEFITGSDEQGKSIKVKVRPAGKGEFPRPELAKTDAQFAEIFARELTRTGIEDPSFNRSETVNRITKLMDDFGCILDIEFPGIKKQDPAYIEMRGVIGLFFLYIKTLPGKTQVNQIIPAAPTYLWGLSEAEIEKILETIIPADRESARLLFSGQKPKGKICLSKADFIYAVGRLIRNRVINISKEDAIEFFNAHFSKNDGSSYSKSTIGKYLSSANVILGGSVFVFLSSKK